MRQFVSPKVGKSTIRLCAAVLLAGVATGCSSDASRFDGLFSRSDTLTTNSIQRNTTPVPRGDVANGQMAVVSPADTRNSALGQPYPAANGAYDPVNTSSTPMSTARAASTPINVQRSTLADPTATASRGVDPQPFPAARQVEQASAATRQALPAAANEAVSKSGWTTQNAPAVMVRQGDSVSILSKRFGVPEKEILKANGLKTAGQVEPGQRLVIPTFGVASSAAKAAASNTLTDVDGGKRQPSPLPTDQRDVAILPGQSQSRDKSEGKADVAAGKTSSTGEGGGDGSYTVKPGNSLNRIAKATGVSVGALKQANGLTANRSASARL